MARKRMVDPEFWLDEDITSLSFECRLFYIGTWNFADDYGVIENSAKKIKAQVFPYDDVDAQKIIDKLVKLGKLVPFEAEGKSWLYIKRFLKYQRVDRPSVNRNPQAPLDVLGDDSSSTQDEVSISKEKLSEVKREYGELKKVRLTDSEYKKLVERIGEPNALLLIGELDTYIASRGVRYSSHYATLLNWARRKVVEFQKDNKPKRTLA